MKCRGWLGWIAPSFSGTSSPSRSVSRLPAASSRASRFSSRPTTSRSFPITSSAPCGSPAASCSRSSSASPCSGASARRKSTEPSMARPPGCARRSRSCPTRRSPTTTGSRPFRLPGIWSTCAACARRSVDGTKCGSRTARPMKRPRPGGSSAPTGSCSPAGCGTRSLTARPATASGSSGSTGWSRWRRSPRSSTPPAASHSMRCCGRARRSRRPRPARSGSATRPASRAGSRSGKGSRWRRTGR